MRVRVPHPDGAGLWTVSGPGLLRRWRGEEADVLGERWEGGVAGSARGQRPPSASCRAVGKRRHKSGLEILKLPKLGFVARQLAHQATVLFISNIPTML